ncbi:MAG: MFS transporter [Chloroflexi bacterium]|nr:MFS transporter [Chloroflexota bacterium]
MLPALRQGVRCGVVRILARRHRVFYGWWIVGASFLLQALVGGLLFHGFSAYFLRVQDALKTSRTMVAAGLSLNRVESGLLGPLEGWAIDRWGPRPVVLLGSVLFGVGFILFSFVNSPLAYFGAFAVLAAGSSLAGFTAVGTVVVAWFREKRSRALGIALSGIGAGGMLVPLLSWSIETFDWRATARASGLVILALGVPMAFVLRRSPERYGMHPDGAPPAPGAPALQTATRALRSEAPALGGRDFTAPEALRAKAFWFLSLGHASALLVVGAVSVHQVPHMVQQMKLSLQQAGNVVGFLTFMMVVGQVLGGYLGDRFDKRRILMACMGGHSLGLLFLAYATSGWHLLAFGVLHGLAWGIRGTLLQAVRADYFGLSSFGKILGFANLISGIGQFFAPLFAAIVADTWGSYTPAFAILAVMAALGSIFFLVARKPVHRHAPGEQGGYAAPQ